MILDPQSVDRDLTLQADVCVVGSGAGGSVAAHELVAAGRSVVLLEEGSYWTSAQFTQLEEEMYPRLYRERGTKPTADYTVLVSQGRALGGSSVVSFCLCVRTPRRIVEHWREQHGLEEFSYESLFPHFERVESAIGVKRMGPQDLNRNNEILLQGSERLGYGGQYLRHNRTDCLGCGYCALGCAYDRKGDMLTTYLHSASRRGARILPGVHADKILHDGKRVAGVSGLLRSKGGKSFEVRVEAPLVVLAAGAIESPMLWIRSRLPDPHRLAGRNLRLHPYAVVAGMFDDPVRSWQGVPQSYVVDEFLNLESRIEGGFLMLAAASQPVASASLLPGLGAEHRVWMDRYDRIGAVAFFLHDHSAGQVKPDRRGRAILDYHLDDQDKRDVMHAMRTGSELLFAAGAKSVVLPYNDRVEIDRQEKADVIEKRGIVANDPLFLSFQPQGTLRMGGSRKTALVGSWGQAHGIRGLYVADASVFPTSVAVPPQVTVMALARRTAEHILGTT